MEAADNQEAEIVYGMQTGAQRGAWMASVPAAAAGRLRQLPWCVAALAAYCTLSSACAMREQARPLAIRHCHPQAPASSTSGPICATGRHSMRPPSRSAWRGPPPPAQRRTRAARAKRRTSASCGRPRRSCRTGAACSRCGPRWRLHLWGPVCERVGFGFWGALLPLGGLPLCVCIRHLPFPSPEHLALPSPARALCAVFAIVALKMGLSSGVQAHLNVGAGLLSYFTISSWRKVFGRWKWLAGKPFTAQVRAGPLRSIPCARRSCCCCCC